jgi:hypothetical protein
MRKPNYIALGIGTALSIATAVSVYWRADFVESSLTARGEIIRLNTGGHHPEIAFVTKAGEHTSFPAGSVASAGIGDAVPVRYDPAAPRETARIDTFFGIWNEQLFLGALTVLMLLAGWTGASAKGWEKR